jgi:hypothetical protein
MTVVAVLVTNLICFGGNKKVPLKKKWPQKQTFRKNNIQRGKINPENLPKQNSKTGR